MKDSYRSKRARSPRFKGTVQHVRTNAPILGGVSKGKARDSYVALQHRPGRIEAESAKLFSVKDNR